MIKNTQKSAHLVSPCHLKYFDVKRENVICGDYSYDSRDGIAYCNEPDIGSGDEYIPCGTFDESIDGYVEGVGVYEMVKEEMESNKILFEGEGEDLKIYIPLISTDDTPEYITNMVEKEHKIIPLISAAGCIENDPEWEEKRGKSCYGIENTYTVDIYRGAESIGLSHLAKKGDIAIQKDKEYVLHIYRVGIDLVFDIYPVELCKDNPLLVGFGQAWPGEENRMVKQLTCEQVNGVTETASANEIKNIADYAFDEKTEKKIRVTPDSDMEVRDIMANIILLWETLGENCGYGAGRKQCFRVLLSPMKKEMLCETKYTYDKESNGNTCQLDMDFDGTKEFKILRNGTKDLEEMSSSDYYSVSSKFYDPEFLFSSKEPGFVIAFEDNDLDGTWDTVKAWGESDKVGIEKWLSVPDGIISLSDIENGVPKHSSMKNCYTPGIVLDFGDNLDNRMMDDIEPNYCLRHKSTTAIILEYAWIPITAVSLTVATIFGGPLGFYGTWAVLSGGGLVSAGTSLAADWKMSWPTR